MKKPEKGCRRGLREHTLKCISYEDDQPALLGFQDWRSPTASYDNSRRG